jgi:hypothetical protein
MGEAAAQQKLGDHIDFYSTHTTSFAVVGNPSESCGMSEGVAYKEVARATGGSFASVCARDLSETINEIIFAASAQAGYRMPETPISSSLRVYLNGEWVPRSRENGFDYFESTDSIAFFGNYRPELPENGEAPDVIAISYQTWQDRTKD